MERITQRDADTAYIKLRQALTVIRSATQEVYKVELAASDETRAATGGRWLEYVCSVDLRDARIMLEAAESLAYEAYEAVSVGA